jgi:hypothetical protein
MFIGSSILALISYEFKFYKNNKPINLKISYRFIAILLIEP